MIESNTTYQHKVHELSCGYGVYTPSTDHQKNELLLICNSPENAHLIRMILDYDALGIDYKEVSDLDDIDIANSSILDYLDKIYPSKAIKISEDKDRNLSITLSGLGRVSKLSEEERDTLKKLKATDYIVINRKIGPIRLWSAAVASV